MRTHETKRQQWVAAGVAAGAAVLMAVVVAITPHQASTYQDPNSATFASNSLQDTLNAAILKCALGRPDCVGQTGGPGGSVTIDFDGTNYQLRIQVPGTLPIIADKIKGKAMQLFQDQMALANSISPGIAEDPNNFNPQATSDHALDPNSVNSEITSTLSFKVRTADGSKKGVMTVSASPSFAVRWDLKLK